MSPKMLVQLVLLLFLLSSSCVKKTTNITNITPSPVSNGAASSKLYPLQVRNFWLYEVTQYDSMGKETKSSFLQRITGKIVWGRDTFYKVSGTGNVSYRSAGDSLTLIADSIGNITPRFQYNKQAGTIRKIGSMAYTSGVYNYYSFYGLVTYNSNLNRPCLLITTEDVPRNTKTPISKVDKYVQPGVGVIALRSFALKSDTSTVKEYVLTEKWELKDYYLYP